MNDTLEFIDDLKELKALHQSGDLREFVIDVVIQKYESRVAEYEKAMEDQHELFFGGTPFYNPTREV